MSDNIYEISVEESVMRGVDAYAKRLGLTRSEAINSVLAEKCGRVYSYETSVSGYSERLIEILTADGLSPGFLSLEGGSAVSVRSFFGLKYRPAVRYEIKLDGDGRNGVIDIAVRTSSDEIRRGILDFLRTWISAEDRIFSLSGRRPADYTVSEGRIRRKIRCPRAGSSDSVGLYVRTFDESMKKYISGALGPEGVFTILENYFFRDGNEFI
ncbi:MAG: hypothetical protein J5830_01905 [Clostridia bacterium]|nr:hypothetical protein [Clostridia bacterium]